MSDEPEIPVPTEAADDSVDMAAIDQSKRYSAQENRKPLPRCYPKWRGKPLYDGNPEVLGWTLTSVALAINFIGAGSFLATAILRVATEAYKCHLEFENSTVVDVSEVCAPAIRSLDPSSLLTTYSMVIGLTAAIMLPFIGAVTDYTKHRLRFGRTVSLLFTIFLFPLMMLNQNNYIIILCCHAVTVFLQWFVTAFQYSYFPDLTESELQLANWTKWITIWTYLGMMAYLAIVIGSIFALGKATDNIFTSRFGMAVSFAVNLVLVTVSWWCLFDKRPPLHERPEKGTLCTLGFKQLFNTGCHIAKNFHSLKWFYVYVCLSDAGWQSFTIILVTYLTSFMNFTAIETSIAIVISLFGSIPGAVIASFFAARLDPLRSLKLNLVNMMVCIVIFVCILTGPGQQVRAYCVVSFIGFCGGWKYTLDRLIGSSIIPKGQDTELMGLYLFSGQCLAWLPLLVFTVLNEAGLGIRINVALLIVYLLLASVAIVMVGSYAHARAQVKRSTIYDNCDKRASTTNPEQHCDQPSTDGDEAEIAA